MSQAALNTCNYNEEEKNSWRRSNGGRLLGISFLLGILVSIFISGWMLLDWMKDAKHLPLLKVVLTGEQHYTCNNDIRQSILALGSPVTFITHDVNLIQSEIKRLPWIKQATVRKQWPNIFKIHLVEYVPIARWNDQYLIDSDGNLFTIPSKHENQKNLPSLHGPEGSDHEALQDFRKMGQLLAKHCFILKDATITARHSWQLTLTSGTNINLGRCDIMERLLRFIVLYPILQEQAKAENKEINYVDLRYNSGAAVGWKPILIEEPNQQ